VGKADVIEFLEKHKGWFTTTQIKEQGDIKNASANLGSLYKNPGEMMMHNLERRDYKSGSHVGYEWRIK